jgi:hypothetical protein
VGNITATVTATITTIKHPTPVASRQVTITY